MIMAYNPYNAINAIYNYKKNWATANEAGNEEAKKKAAENAQVFYQQLRDNDYGKVADELSALDESGAKYIVDQYKPKSTIETNNLKSNEVNRENAGLFDKYNATYDELTKTNPFTTDEAKAILGKYSLAGLQARDNATASGGASNGGNIDSYASANAMRQQASLISQGQQTVLNSHQQKIDNIRGLLSDMGVNIDRVFNQDETSKNNDVARKSEIASVTGYAPDEWVVSNNPYMNDDGTIKEQYKDIDFSKIMAEAKEANNTNLYNAAAMARFYKIMGDYGTYGQYDDGNYIVPGQQITESRRESEQNNATVLKTLESENENKAADRQNAIDQIKAKTQGEKEVIAENAKYTQQESDDYAEYNTFLSMFDVSETRKRAFIEEKIKPIYEGKTTTTPEGLKQLILTNTQKYNIDVDDAKLICRAFGVDTSWLNSYRDRTDDDGVLDDGTAGKYGGMVKK